jgi:hypothetical protein
MEHVMITGTIVKPGEYADGKARCEISISATSSDILPHKYRQKKLIFMKVGDILYEAGVHETKQGGVWISAVLFKKGRLGREHARLVDALADIGLRHRDAIRIKADTDGTFLLQRL